MTADSGSNRAEKTDLGLNSVLCGERPAINARGTVVFAG
jgi:hypothetical protein